MRWFGLAAGDALPLLLARRAARRAAESSVRTPSRFTSIEGDALPLAGLRRPPGAGGQHRLDVRLHLPVRGAAAAVDAYRDRGLVVLGVPSNDFGGQEPGSAAEIKTVLRGQFRRRLPADREGHVKGDVRIRCSPGCGASWAESPAPRWNFHKYLIGPDGTARGAHGHPGSSPTGRRSGRRWKACWRRRPDDVRPSLISSSSGSRPEPVAAARPAGQCAIRRGRRERRDRVVASVGQAQGLGGDPGLPGQRLLRCQSEQDAGHVERQQWRQQRRGARVGVGRHRHRHPVRAKHGSPVGAGLAQH